MHPDMVMTAFEVGESEKVFDLLLVDEAHRLNQRANESSGVQNRKFREITETLFGSDDTSKTQLDWIKARSRHQIVLVDAAQSVRPADVPSELLEELVGSARAGGRLYPLMSQMRVAAGDDYVGYVRRMLGGGHTSAFVLGEAVHPQDFEGYDFRMFDSVAAMQAAVRARDVEVGLSRLLAGHAWEWKSRGDRAAFDIEIDGVQLRWNSTQTDWIASPGSLEEVGSIHTVQGYDLNYAGVIIGRDLRYDPVAGQLFVDRGSYFDTKGKENNRQLGVVYSDEDLLRFVRNVYAVLLTRGIRGTYVFVQDEGLGEYLGRFIPRFGF
ncbi:hypothetical protein GCM10009563_10440 [Subtercola frigoramans]